jgi:subtilisin-like proprotein convertase family protein
MKKTSLLFLTSLVFSFFCLFYFEPSQAQSAPETVRLFELIGTEKFQSSVSMAAVREQEIEINFSNVDFENARELGLPLLDGKLYQAIRRESEGFIRFADDEFTWRGKIFGDNDWNGDVTLTVKAGALSGLIYSPGGVYEIVPQANSKHLLVQIDQSQFLPCGGAIPAKPENVEAHEPSIEDGQIASDDGSQIDVLVVYTVPFRQSLGGTSQAQAFAQQAIASANTAYQNSNINPRLRLVSTLEVNFTEDGTLSTALHWVDSDATVAAARNTAKADMVAMLVDTATDSCGLAYVMRSVGPGFSTQAFSATARECAIGNLSFAHELGHNQGCEHNPENGGPSNEASYPYAYGHYIDNSFRTVMSYSNPCPSGCTRVAYFSNPSITFNGFATGIANQRDNHRVINNTALTISQFRDSSGGGGGGPANNNFASAQVISNNSGSVTGSNVNATKESGEPNHAGNIGGASIWYRWQAPASGSVTITTAGSNFDTVLGVYTGSSVSALTTIASNDDNGGVTSSVTFNAAGGTIYRVAVDGYNGATGNVTLNWNLASSPTDTTPPSLNITSHTNGQTVTTSSITVSGNATDSGRGDSGITSVTVNGVRATGDTATGAGTANWSRTISLNPGSNAINVIAKDGKPNSTTRSITVNRTTTGGPYTISGTVKVGTAGLTGVKLTLTGGTGFTPRTFTTTSTGVYTFSNLAAGRNYTIKPSKLGYGFTPASRTFTNLSANQTASTASFTAALKNYRSSAVKQILDLSTMDVPIVVNDVGTITDLNVRLRLNHTYDGDLDIYLIGPDGTIVELTTDNGSSGDNYGSGANSCGSTPTVFDNTGTVLISSGTAPFAGKFKPEQLLSAFNGKSSKGTWKLRIIDDAGGDVGTLYCWELQFNRP